MTGGRVVVLGRTGRNFAAGMSGGIAYVYDKDRRFEGRCNLELVDLEELAEDDEEEVRALISEHAQRTGSLVARNVLASWERARARFVKVMPRDYKRVLAERAEAERAEAEARRSAPRASSRASRRARISDRGPGPEGPPASASSATPSALGGS